MSQDDVVINHLMDIERQLGTLTAECKAANEAIHQHLQDDVAVRDRVTALETTQNRWKWGLAGASALFVAVAKAAEWIWSAHH